MNMINRVNSTTSTSRARYMFKGLRCIRHDPTPWPILGALYVWAPYL